MTLKEQLIQEINLMPEDLVVEMLHFAEFLKLKRTKQLNFNESQAKLPYRPASGRSLLRHISTWQGDDFEECLQKVYTARSKTEFGWTY